MGEYRGQAAIATLETAGSLASSEPETGPMRKFSDPLEPEDDKKRFRVSAAYRYPNQRIFEHQDSRVQRENLRGSTSVTTFNYMLFELVVTSIVKMRQLYYKS